MSTSNTYVPCSISWRTHTGLLCIEAVINGVAFIASTAPGDAPAVEIKGVENNENEVDMV
jgi:hypothetical protein